MMSHLGKIVSHLVSHLAKMVSHMVSVRVPHVSGRDLRLWSHTMPSLILVSALSEGDQEHGLKYYGHPMGRLETTVTRRYIRRGSNTCWTSGWHTVVKDCTPETCSSFTDGG